ncbi:uncharacterized protein LAESUDRAFT_728961 [Laetiporus sulphureus 93-53]|uniref:Uncharacterized protein n=1 Tax=Laetiporus sulphureus 93-53 TaxID=1314785 RepID=A0A165CXI2_9APHY|nr:uncharacterized protein LAESUDRAFT_728961 [Laetiporus sulphureus 93-53]KZT03674.1 hypothetical protein LAESUDRAFT_728961 [Laetiporus sulphureus 93-53]
MSSRLLSTVVLGRNCFTDDRPCEVFAHFCISVAGWNGAIWFRTALEVSRRVLWFISDRCRGTYQNEEWSCGQCGREALPRRQAREERFLLIGC